MEIKELILKEIEKVPEQYLAEILDFIHFIESKTFEESLGTGVLSETSLKKDWLRPEEDKAWQDL